MQIGKFLLELLLLPGRIVQWSNYLFPQKGRVRISARQKDSLFIRVLWSVVFWVLLYVILLKPILESTT